MPVAPLALPLPSPRPCGSALAARPGGRLRSCGATRRTARGAACVSESVRSRAGRGVARRSPASDRVRPACARGDRGRRGLAAAVRPERSAQGPTAERAPCLVAVIVGYPARGSVRLFGFARTTRESRLVATHRADTAHTIASPRRHATTPGHARIIMISAQPNTHRHDRISICRARESRGTSTTMHEHTPRPYRVACSVDVSPAAHGRRRPAMDDARGCALRHALRPWAV